FHVVPAHAITREAVVEELERVDVLDCDRSALEIDAPRISRIAATEKSERCAIGPFDDADPGTFRREVVLADAIGAGVVDLPRIFRVVIVERLEGLGIGSFDRLIAVLDGAVRDGELVTAVCFFGAATEEQREDDENAHEKPHLATEGPY